MSTITALAPTLFSAAQEVSNEPFGVIDSINTSFDDKGVAKGDYVKVPYAPTQTNSAFTPAATPPAGSDVTAAAVSVEITKSQKNSMVLTGEQIRSLENGDTYQEWVRQWTQQAMRALRNEAEEDACVAVKQGASRAYGTAGTTPFASNLDDLIQVRKILKDNGAPMSDLQLVMDSAAEVNLLKLNVIQQASAAGSDTERRQGYSLSQFGFRLQSSSGIATHTKGTATGMDCTAVEPIGETTIACDGSDSGTILAGDVIVNTTLGDGYKYVVADGSTLSGAASGNFIINRPGLLVATTIADEWTIGNSYTPNMAFERNAVVGIMRPPVMPQNANIDTMLITDKYGLTYLMLDISQYGQRTWEMHLAWGFKVVQSEHVALLLG